MEANIMKYIDSIDWGAKNQLGKVLEHCFYEKQHREYTSCIKDESEDYSSACDLTKEDAHKTMKKLIGLIADFIVGANVCAESDEDYELDEEYFENNFLNLDPLTDKIMAMILMSILDAKSDFRSVQDFYDIAVIGAKELSNDELSSKETANSIDVSKLKTGMTVKNYKVLCELLNQPVKDGTSKKAQFKDFKCYFDWEKSGQKFIITDVYDTPLTREDRRKLGNNSIYVQCIELILLQYLSQQTKYTRSFTKKKWWSLLGITSEKYGNVPEQELKKLDYSVTSYEIKHFYQRCNKKLDSILLSALRNLRNRRLIEFEPQTIIVIRNEKGEDKYFAANDEEKKKILNAERYILRVMGFETMTQMFMSFKQKEFYEKVNTFLNEACGWHHYYRQIKIICVPETIKEILPTEEIELQRQLLNDKVVGFLNNNAQEIYDKNRKQTTEIINSYTKGKYTMIPDNVRIWNYPDTYVMAQKALTDELVRIGHKDMKFSPEEFWESNDSELDALFDII